MTRGGRGGRSDRRRRSRGSASRNATGPVHTGGSVEPGAPGAPADEGARRDRPADPWAGQDVWAARSGQAADPGAWRAGTPRGPATGPRPRVQADLFTDPFADPRMAAGAWTEGRVGTPGEPGTRPAGEADPRAGDRRAETGPVGVAAEGQGKGRGDRPGRRGDKRAGKRADKRTDSRTGKRADQRADKRADKRAKRRRSVGEAAEEFAGRELTDKQRRVLVGVAGGGAALAAAVGLAVLIGRVAGLSDVPQAAAGSALAADVALPDDYQSWASLKQFDPINDRKADAKPITAQEIFPKSLQNGRIRLKLVKRTADRDCAAAVQGGDLAAELTEAGCRQAVRGFYRSTGHRYVAQYTLFDLTDVTGANRFVRSLDTLHRGAWVRPVQGATELVRGGYSEGSGHAMGHFAGVVWIGRADGAEPTAKDDFVSLSLAVRGAEKAVFRRVVAAGAS